VARAAAFFGNVLIVFAFVFATVTESGAAEGERVRMDEPFEITADRIDFDNARQLYVATGHVRVDQADRRLKAKWIAFSNETRIGVAQGDVQLDDGPDRLQAAFMVFDVDTLQGLMFQGSVDSGGDGFMVRAMELVRTGKNTFTARDGRFTTCRCEPDEKLPWEIHSSKAEIELGGHGTITNSTFNVLGVPVLWVPWAFFPVKSERETGFLFPTFAFGGRGGAAIGVPFFWAAHPQLNLTLTPHYFVERGFKQDIEAEYVFGQRSEGRLFLAGLRDQTAKSGDAIPKRRWAILWDHDQDLPGDWRWKADLNLASDNLYSDDFIELREFKSYRFVESTTQVERDFGSSGGVGAMVGMRYADDIQGANRDDRDEFMLQRWTEARSDIQAGTLTAPLGIEARLDSELIYFAGLRSPGSDLAGQQPGVAPLDRDDGRFFDIGFDGLFDGGPPSVAANGERDGVFQPGEPLDESGARLVLHPRIARTFRLGDLAEFVPEAGWHQTLYRTSSQRFAERGLITGRAELRTRLARDYVRDDGTMLRHVLEPRLGWAFVSQQRQNSNPLFIPRSSTNQSRLRALSLENVTRDPSDRIDRANQLVLALGQRFFANDRAGKGPRLKADITTAVDWDFSDEERGLGNLYVEGRLFPVGPFSSEVRSTFNPETTAFEEAELGVGLSSLVPGPLLHAFSLNTTYRYVGSPPQFLETLEGTTSTREIGDTELNQLSWAAKLLVTDRVRLSYRAVFSLVSDEGFIKNQGMIEYVSKCRCWGLGVTVSQQRRQGFRGGFEVRFLGLGDDGGSLFDKGLGAGLNL
jgi:lipopolysaccharide assembly outer membrane protein LptD (OstA)